jgi:glutamyl-tRNA synthetase
LNKSAATFDWDKLLWVNQHYIQNAAPGRLVDLAKPYLEAAQIPLADGPDIGAAVEAQRTRAKTLVEIAEQSHMFYGHLIRDENAAKKHLRPVVGPALEAIRERFASLDTWDGEALKGIVEQTAAAFDMKLGKVAQPLRVAVTGFSASPSIDVTLELVGKKKCLERLDAALVYIAERAAA